MAQIEVLSGHIAAALEEIADTCRIEIARTKRQPEQGEPTVRDEIQFYERQLRAFEKALGYWLRGVRPVQTPSGAWLIPSGSQAGAVQHHCEKVDHLWLCGPTCKATTFHWHQALMTAIESVGDRLDAEDDGDAVHSAELYSPALDVDPEPFLPTHYVEPAARVVVVRPIGQRLAEARAAYL